MIDQGIELLTGVRAGEPLPGGGFPAGSINAQVAARLQAFSAARQAFAASTGAAGRRRSTGRGKHG